MRTLKPNLKTYNKILKRNIEKAKIMHYHQKLTKIIQMTSKIHGKSLKT